MPGCVAPYCTPGQAYNYQGCLTPAALAQPYCNTSLSIAARVASLVSSLNITEKANRMSVNSEGPVGDDTYRRLGLPPYAWLMETNTAANAACLNGTRCATNFVGPEGLAASFNRSVWRSKGEVVSTEQRAFSNNGAVKKPGSCSPPNNPCYVSNTCGLQHLSERHAFASCACLLYFSEQIMFCAYEQRLWPEHQRHAVSAVRAQWRDGW